jgi:hypothetical protein
MILEVHSHHRRQGTRTKAGHRLKRKLLICGCLPYLDAESPFDFIPDTAGPSQMTGSSVTNSYQMLAAFR